MRDTQFVDDLRLRYNGGEGIEFVFFWGHRPGKGGVTSSCFSQWYRAPFTIEGNLYPTAEHFMMAEKAALFGDRAIRAQVLQAPSPGAAKALGRQISGFEEATWLEERFSLVVRANRAKFAQNPKLDQYLRHTGSRVLVEASPVHKIGGIGLAREDERVDNPNLWLGLNLLGFALMQVRDGA